jgi:hypothetical protein
MKSELRDAIREGNLPGVKLMVEGRASIAGTRVEWSALELAVITGDIAIVKWLLEYGGADIMDTTSGGRTVWELLEDHFYFARMRLELGDRVGVDLPPSLLRAMVLQSAPLADLLTRMTPQYSRVAEEGARLRAGLPAYLARRRALIDDHTSLIAPLWALVSSYEEPTTTEELWATGLGVLAP